VAEDGAGATLRGVDVVLVLLGVAGLYAGGELLVRNASRLAAALGLSPLVIGLTVVAFGTSAPELAATLAAAFRGAAEIATGNVVGSNIANVGLILGLMALVYPLMTSWAFIRREVPFMVLATVLALALFADGRLGALEGSVLLAAMAAFLLLAFRAPGEVATAAVPAVVDGGRRGSALVPLALALTGIAVLIGGAQALVAGAVSIAQDLGVSQRVIGLTMVAIGTSLPELASSMVAALRRETDLILGNIVGSNVFNLLFVLGLAALVHPFEVDVVALRIDLIVMTGFSLVLVPMVITGLRVGRAEGAVLLLAYGAYVAFLFR
jgi:cation:H+ antiporter